MTPEIETDVENQSPVAPPNFEADLDGGSVALGVLPPLMLER
jgi:hypothetical protein